MKFNKYIKSIKSFFCLSILSLWCSTSCSSSIDLKDFNPDDEVIEYIKKHSDHKLKYVEQFIGGHYTHFYFDKKNNLVKIEKNHPLGYARLHEFTCSITENFYDNENRCIKTTVLLKYKHEPDTIEFSDISYLYNIGGKLIQSVKHTTHINYEKSERFINHSFDTTTFEYNAKSQLTKKNIKFHSGELDEYIFENNLLLEVHGSDAKGDQTEKINFAYDELNNLTKLIRYSKSSIKNDTIYCNYSYKSENYSNTKSTKNLPSEGILHTIIGTSHKNDDIDNLKATIVILEDKEGKVRYAQRVDKKINTPDDGPVYRETYDTIEYYD